MFKRLEHEDEREAYERAQNANEPSEPIEDD